MPLVKLTLNSLDEGRVLEAVQEALDRAARDVADRPKIKKARRVALTIEIASDGDVDDCTPEINWTVATSLPGTKSKGIKGKLDRHGQIVVPDFGVDPEQMHLGDISEDDKRVDFSAHKKA